MISSDDCLALNIRVAGSDGGYRVKVQGGGGVDGGKELNSVLAAASRKGSLSRQAAVVGIGIRHHQPFRDGNTRTGLLALYLVLMNSGVSIRRKPYQVYAWLDRFDDRYRQDSEAAVSQLAELIQGSSFNLAAALSARNRGKNREERVFTANVFDELVDETLSLKDLLAIFARMSQSVNGGRYVTQKGPDSREDLQARRDDYTTQFLPQERHMFQRFLAEKRV